MKNFNCVDAPSADLLINDISKLFDDNIRRKSVNYPTYEQFGGKKGFSARHILFYLAHHKDEGVNQLALVKFTHLTAPTVSVALQKLEAQGLIVREPNPNDMRETIVKITSKGIDFDNFIKRSIDETREVMFSGISESEIAALKATLIKVRENMMNSFEKGTV